MKSTIVFTDEIDDLDLAVSELSSKVREKLKFEKASIGIVFCDADVDVAELGKKLNTELNIEIVGITTTASFDRVGGYRDMGIVLTAITSSDVDIKVGFSGDFDESDFESKIRASYDEVSKKLDGDPKFIYLCSPYIIDITSDNYLDLLDEMSNHTPIFGGVATDHYDYINQKTFYNGESFGKGIVYVMFSGNVRPVFSMVHEFGGITEGRGVVTKSDGNQVERVGDCTFLEYITAISPVPEDEMVIHHFQATPFVMEMPNYDKSEQPIVRALCTIDHETGKGGFLSNMPEGSVLSINAVTRENLKGSCEETLSTLAANMRKNPDYEYSTIFISTCNARHLMMGDTKNLESNILASAFTEFDGNLDAAGFYGFGEMCPTAVDESGKAKNRFHNISFATCAF